MTSTYKANLITYLNSIGLSEKEATLYLALVEKGATTTTNLSKITEIPRTTVFENIEKLIAKGLVSTSIQGGKNILLAEPPENLNWLIDQKRSELETDLSKVTRLQEGLKEFSDNIKALKSVEKSGKDIEVKVFKGKEAVMKIYKDTLDCDEVRSFVNLDKYFELYPGTQGMWEEALEKNKDRHLYAIVVDTEKAKWLANINNKEDHKRYHQKYIHDPKTFGGLDIHIYEDKVALIELEDPTPTATVMYSKVIKKGLEVIHKQLWKIL